MKIDNFSFKIQLIILNLIVFITIALIVIFGIFFTDPFLAIPPWIDAKVYLKMFESPFNDGSEAPYKYRILTPLIVSLLPVGSLTGFIIVNLASLYATSILFYFYLKKLNFSFGVL